MTLRDSLPSDSTLVARTLSSAPAAFEKLVLRYQQKAFAIARAHGVSPGSVDDVVQESFLQALCGLRELRSPASFGPWFLAIVRNLSRKEVESSRRPMDPAKLERRLEPERPVDAADLEEMRERLWHEVQGLPEGIREAIFLYYHDGESVRRVAKTLEVSTAAVKSRLQRGRDQLRQRLWRELEDSLRDMLPSTREWKQRGRRLTLFLLAAATSERALGREAVASSPVEGADSLVHTATTGALIMSLKKLFLGAGLAALLLAASLVVLSHSFHHPADDSRTLADRGAPTTPAGPAGQAPIPEEKPAASPRPAARPATGVAGTVFREKGQTPAADVFVAAILAGVT